MHGCIRVTQSSEYVWFCLHTPQKWLNMSQCTLMSLNMPEHRWILLNVCEYVWINCSDYARVLNMSQYGYNNIIIIVAIVIMFLPRILVCSINTFSSSVSILSFFNMSLNIIIVKASKLLTNFPFWLQWRQSFRSIYMNSWM